ncbi:MAG: hypothetical protein GC185_00470 [Alphaproteobacteria bacterium]|nr:hypothetical protein [Alphaproteobacteria bacterium]
MSNYDFDEFARLVAEGELETVKRHCADPAVAAMRNGRAEGLIHKAAYAGREDVVEFFIQKMGVDINLPDKEGYTPLHEAARGGKADVVRLLLKLGANPDLKISNGDTPLDAGRGFPAVKAALAEAANRPRWLRSGEAEVTHVVTKTAIGYRLTEIFNFGTRSYLLLTQNLETKAETSALRAFSDIADTTLVRRAEEALLDMGGKLPEDYAMLRLDKPKPGLKLSGRRLGG